MSSPWADTHVHLLAGLDDGPAHLDEAVAMVRALLSEGVRHASGLAHQNPDYPQNTAAHLRQACENLEARLREEQLAFSVYPTGEVMLSPTTYEEYQQGRLLTLGDRRKLLLVEMPHGLFMDVLPLQAQLAREGVRLVIAHTERYPELLYDLSLGERWFAAGCLFQFSSGEFAQPYDAQLARALRTWAERGLVHMLGTDAHNLTRRPPIYRQGVANLSRWVGPAAAERMASHWGIAALQGLPIHPPRLKPRPKSFWARWLAR